MKSRNSQYALWRALCLSVAFVVLPAISLKAQSLADTLASAYEHSGLIDQNRALLRSADEDVAIAVSSLRPIINWSSDISREFGKTKRSGLIANTGTTNANLGITASLLLYDFGRSKLSVEAAKEVVLATRQLLISVEQQVLFRAVQAHMNVIRNSQIVALRQNNLRLLREQLRATNQRFEVGEVTNTDVAQAQARVAAAQSGLALARGDLTQAVEEYRSAAGRKPASPRAPTNLPRLPGDVESAKQTAIQNHPDVRQAQHDVSAAALSIRIAETAVKPTVNLFAGGNVGTELGGSDYARTGSFGVNVEGPIYQGGRLNAQRRKAIAQREAALGALHFTRHQIRQNVGSSYAILRASRAGRAASQEAVRASTIAFEGVREETTLGARTTLDVLDAEQELLDAKTDLISSSIDVQIAAYAVLASLGQLTVKDLNLAVPTYDPASYYNLAKDAPIRSSKQGQKLEKILRTLNKK